MWRGQRELGDIPHLYELADLTLTTAAKDLTPERWQDLRRKAQERVMAQADPVHLGRYRDQAARAAVSRIIAGVIETELPGLPLPARQGMVNRLTSEIHGYGPFEPLLDDPAVADIVVERYDQVLVERDGKLKTTDTKFDSEEHLRLVVDRIITPLGRRLDEASPIVDARLPDGSRVCAVIPPLAPNGTMVTIRRFRPQVTMDNLVEWGMLSPAAAEFLAACVRGRLNLIVSGGTGSGKTTLLNSLSAYIAPDLSVITIENPLELQLSHPHVRQLEARPANIEGKGEVNIMALVIAALRMRPDILIVGEVRGREAFAMIQAMNTGHLGSMTTLHANSTGQALERLVAMVASAQELPRELVPAYIAETVDLVVHLARMPDKVRRLVEIAEVCGERRGKIQVEPLYRFEVQEFAPTGIKGAWRRTETPFSRLDLLKGRGISLPGNVS